MGHVRGFFVRKLALVSDAMGATSIKLVYYTWSYLGFLQLWSGLTQVRHLGFVPFVGYYWSRMTFRSHKATGNCHYRLTSTVIDYFGG